MTPEQIEVVVQAVRERLTSNQNVSFSVESGYHVKRTLCGSCGKPSTEALRSNGTETLTIEVNGGAKDTEDE